jgi:hypothetical protein
MRFNEVVGCEFLANDSTLLDLLHTKLAEGISEDNPPMGFTKPHSHN